MAAQASDAQPIQLMALTCHGAQQLHFMLHWLYGM